MSSFLKGSWEIAQVLEEGRTSSSQENWRKLNILNKGTGRKEHVYVEGARTFLDFQIKAGELGRWGWSGELEHLIEGSDMFIFAF